MELVAPSIVYKESYLAMMSEEDLSPWRRRWKHDGLAREDFDTFLEKLNGQAQGKYLEPGWVPCSEFWLVDAGVVVGRLSLRHTLNEHLAQVGGHIGYDIRPSMRQKGYGKEMLRLGLEKARGLGLTKVLLTCDETNEASKKVIEANGGALEKYYEQGDGTPRKMLFWITL